LTQSDNAVPVAILLGGKGTRLGLQGIPKPMVPFLGRPLLEKIVTGLLDQGFTDLVFLSGHLSEVIEGYFGDGSAFDVRIRHLVEPEPLGTAPATRAAAKLLGNEFLLVYGDIAFDVDLRRFLSRARGFGGAGTLMVHPNDHPHDSDIVIANPVSHRITAFLNKPHPPELQVRNLVNAGIYYLRSAIFDAIPQGPGLHDWGRDVFPSAVRAGYELHAYRSAEYMKDIGTPDRLARATGHFESGFVAKRSMRSAQCAVFLDRDGVINREIDGVHRPADMACLPGAAETVAAINRSPMLAIGVTNQPDLAKGFFGFDDLEAVHAAMDRQLVEAGGFLDDLFFCPHHPETGFPGEVAELKRPCDCRKPAPGMLQAAAALYNIDLAASYMIGDRNVDMMAGRAAGTRTILVHRNAAPDLPEEGINPALADHVVPDLAAAWSLIQQEALA